MTPFHVHPLINASPIYPGDPVALGVPSTILASPTHCLITAPISDVSDESIVPPKDVKRTHNLTAQRAVVTFKDQVREAVIPPPQPDLPSPAHHPNTAAATAVHSPPSTLLVHATLITSTGSYLRKKQWLIVTLLILILVASVINIMQEIRKDRSPPLPSPSSTFAPSRSSDPSKQIFIQNITLSGQELHYPPKNATTEEIALQWLIDKDVLQNDVTAMRQRYALATVWFQSEDRFGNASHLATWATNKSECEWVGVDCDAAGTVTGLDLWKSNVTGRIPDDLGLLTTLTQLTLSNNNLTGTIPSSSLGRLTALTKLNLSINRLRGTIPSSFGKLTALTELTLGGNNLTGTIPSSSLGRLTALTKLDLSINRLLGTIPSSFGKLTALTELTLGVTTLLGTIVPALGDLTALARLDLSANQLTGTIPSSLGNLTTLTGLWMYRNRLSGSIPSSFGGLTALSILRLSDNRLNGTVPSSLGSLTALTELWLHSNTLNGTIPFEFESMTALTKMSMHNNELIGSMPFCDSNQTNHRFTYLIADCNKLSCPCCSLCCPSSGWNGIQGYNGTEGFFVGDCNTAQ